MPNKASPENALIFYCPYLPNRPIPHVDGITRRGCSGQLMLEKANEYRSIGQLLGFYNEQELSKDKATERYNNMPLLTSGYDDLLPPSLGVKVVDFTDCEEDAWEIINTACAVDRPDTLVCIVSVAQTAKNGDQSTEFVPRQSYWMKNGEQVKAIEEEKLLLYSSFHSGSTRTDSVERFGLDIARLGSNKRILASHFIAEIGNKLGFIAKYGA